VKFELRPYNSARRLREVAARDALMNAMQDVGRRSDGEVLRALEGAVQAGAYTRPLLIST
jgi:hypothetical protein